MKDQMILAVDDNGKFLAYIPKMVGHTGSGKRHLAITVLLQNSKGQVLLQKRKHKIFDNLWDFSGATHPLHKPHPCHSEERSDVGIYTNKQSFPLLHKRQDCHALRARNDKKCKICGQDNADETLEGATWRCLKEEWGITDVGEIRGMGAFNYFAKDGEFCENEYCYLMVRKYDGEINLNPNMGYEYKWVKWTDFLKDLESNPKNYTPWAVEGVKILKKTGFLS